MILTRATTMERLFMTTSNSDSLPFVFNTSAFFSLVILIQSSYSLIPLH